MVLPYSIKEQQRVDYFPFDVTYFVPIAESVYNNVLKVEEDTREVKQFCSDLAETSTDVKTLRHALKMYQMTDMGPKNQLDLSK